MKNIYNYIIEQTGSGKMSRRIAIDIIEILKRSERVDNVIMDIAIIGVDLKTSLAGDPKQFWRKLRAGQDCIRNIPQSRKHDLDSFLGNTRNKELYQKTGYLEEIDKFDYPYFNLSPKEASLMDPNQRIFLETAYAVINDAGQGKGILNTRTGLYVGFFPIGKKYQQLISGSRSSRLIESLSGNIDPMISGRISYLLDLKGPSMLVNTACSSSLVALHLACKSIQRGECDQAIAGGIKLNILPLKGSLDIGIESKDGYTRSFDDKSDGTNWSEGVAAVFLKPLSKALEDKDNIYAVIKGSAVNQDGASIGLTAPNAAAQAEVIEAAWKDARVDPGSISYIEAHGTGTELGDPIEVKGVIKAFRKYTAENHFCRIGSVKSNIGHTSEASGLFGLIKAALSLEHKEIPPSIHFDEPNRKIDWNNSPVLVNTSLVPWKRKDEDTPLRAGVSSFGLSGTNCHVVLEEAPPQLRFGGVNPIDNFGATSPQLLLLSAKTETALGELIDNYRRFLSEEENKDTSLIDITYTAATGRDHHEHRLAIVTADKRDLKEKLSRLARTGPEEWKKIGKDIRYATPHIVSLAGRKQGKEGISIQENLILKKDVSVLRKLAGLYVEGIDPDWNILYRDEDARKVSLPPYPFEKTRCWIEIPEKKKEDENNFYYRPKWTLSPALTFSDSQAGPEKTIIIFRHNNDFSLTRELRVLHRNKKIVEVFLSDEYRRLSGDTFKIDCGKQEDFEKIILASEQDAIIYFLGGLELGHAKTLKINDLDRIQELSTLSLLSLIKAVDSRGSKKSITLKLITNNVYKITNNEKTLYPHSSSILGLSRTASREYPCLKIYNIDISRDDVKSRKDLKLLGQLIKNEIRNDVNFTAAAYRGGQRYEYAISPIDMRRNETGLSLRKNGSYLIVGGSGKIGTTISLYLAEKYRAKIIMIGRRKEDREIRKKIKDIKDRGGEAMYIAADVRNLRQVEDAMKIINGQFKFINGVIYAATEMQNNLIGHIDEKIFTDNLNTKTRGSYILSEAIKEKVTDFFVFFSSVNSQLGLAGAANYVSGCNFQDNFSIFMNTTGKIPCLAVNWGYWQTEFSRYNDTVNNLGILPITHQEGIEIFEKILSFGHEQIIAARLTDPALKSLGVNSDKRICFQENFVPHLIDTIVPELRMKMSSDVRMNRSRIAREKRIFNNIDHFGLTGLLNFFQNYGFLNKPKEIYDEEKIRSTIGIIPQYDRLFRLFLDILCQEGYITRKNGKIIATDKIKTREAKNAKVSETAGHTEEFKDHIKLLSACIKDYPAILTGKKNYKEALFPNGSNGLVENIYRNGIVFRRNNDLVALGAESYIREKIKKDPTTKVNILEIGAGTGVTTGVILDRINKYGKYVEYYYTDIAPDLLRFGREKYGKTSFVQFRILNIERSLEESDLRMGDYDIVVAANVLHATANIKNTINQAKKLLKKNGILILNETTEFSIFASLAFGLSSGWWLFDDKEYRMPNSALLSGEMWEKILENCGFNYINNISGGVLLAESDGSYEIKTGEKEETKPLPLYPVPARLNGKVANDNYTDTERKIAGIWQGVLGYSEFNVNDNFFEIGGGLVLITHVHKKLDELYPGRISVAQLFTYPTIVKLASYISGSQTERSAPMITALPPSTVAQTGDIAIVGISIKTSLSENIDEFWQNLKTGRDLIREIPLARKQDVDRYLDFKASRTQAPYLKTGYLEEIDKFDHSYFRLSPNESFLMDPNQRLFLQAAYEAIDDAGQKSKLKNSRVGIYLGFSADNSYRYIISETDRNLLSRSLPGNLVSVIPSRIAYFLDLHGPSLVVDTGCSSSLVSLHLACRSIKQGECDQAIAGGIKINIMPIAGQGNIGIESKDGLTRSFDDNADGTNWKSEAVVAVFLKPLSRALEDKDHIYAVIKGSAINQDGASAGLTAPNAAAQAEVIEAAWKDAGVDPKTISYIEAHGTGTKLGDPIEIKGLDKAFRKYTSENNFCRIGSVKSNLGHTAEASGLVGLIKTVLSLA